MNQTLLTGVFQKKILLTQANTNPLITDQSSCYRHSQKNLRKSCINPSVICLITKHLAPSPVRLPQRQLNRTCHTGYLNQNSRCNWKQKYAMVFHALSNAFDSIFTSSDWIFLGIFYLFLVSAVFSHRGIVLYFNAIKCRWKLFISDLKWFSINMLL